jgi:hypothetical protein
MSPNSRLTERFAATLSEYLREDGGDLSVTRSCSFLYEDRPSITLFYIDRVGNDTQFFCGIVLCDDGTVGFWSRHSSQNIQHHIKIPREYTFNPNTVWTWLAEQFSLCDRMSELRVS